MESSNDVLAKRQWKVYFWLLIPVLLAVYLRLPFVHAGQPYFYHEDEAHHFNRVVRMVQTGDYNPHYFHKPSLHFYLRMPVVALSFLWSVKKGEIRSIQEVKTEDPFGLAKYNFTASHPRIVSWNRYLSLVFGLGLVALAILISWQLTTNLKVAVLSGSITAFWPALVTNSHVIGVDMPMSFFCLASVSASLFYLNQKKFLYLLLAGLLAGFAVSTKYNALPICLVPIVAALSVKEFCLRRFVIIALLMPVSFFAASPFTLVSLPEFLDQFAYEIWHYGIAGHVGHMAEPGWQQVKHYLLWMSEAYGILGVLILVVATFVLATRYKQKGLVWSVFPISFFVLMSLQKANFERNLLVLLPFAAIALAVGVFGLIKLIAPYCKRFSKVLQVVVCILVLWPAWSRSYNLRELARTQIDTRNQAFDWLHQNRREHQDIALSGELQFPQFVNTLNGERHLSLPGVERISETASIAQLWQAGYGTFVASDTRKISDRELPLIQLEKKFEGRVSTGKVQQNPTVNIYSISHDLPAILDGVDLSQIDLTGKTIECAEEDREADYCWLKKRLTAVQVEGSISSVQVMSPWKDQDLKIYTDGNLLQEYKFEPGKEGVWQTIHLEKINSGAQLLILISEVHSPKSQGISSDSRRLGVALKQ